SAASTRGRSAPMRRRSPRRRVGNEVAGPHPSSEWPGGPIRRLAPIAFEALKRRADHALPPRGGGDPWTADPGRIVTHVLVVSAVELGHPVLLLVAMVTGDVALHGRERCFGFRSGKPTIGRSAPVHWRRWTSSRNSASRRRTACPTFRPATNARVCTDTPSGWPCTSLGRSTRTWA